jgi:dipeptidase
MIKDIRARQSEFEQKAFNSRKNMEKKALGKWEQGQKKQARVMLTDYSDKNARDVLNAWHELPKKLYIKYNDGYINDQNGIGRAVFYPAWWLEKVGYESGPTSYAKPNKN